MRKILLLSLMLLLIINSTVFAAPTPATIEFKVLKVYYNDDKKLVLDGKFFNWGDDPGVVSKVKMIVTIWTSHGMYSNPLEFTNLNINLQGEEVKHGIFIWHNPPIVDIERWSVDTTTYFKYL